MNSTIVSVATPPGIGGVGIVRISGDNALDILKTFHSGYSDSLQPRKLYFGKISYKEKTLDTGYSVFMNAPHSFTGEDVVEFQVHGSPLILNSIVEAIIDSGLAVLSGPGEFTRRAFLNGKMTLDNAEALNILIHSETEYQKRVALAGTEGCLSEEIGLLRNIVIEIISKLEAEIEYPEEEETEGSAENILKDMHTIKVKVDFLVDTYKINKKIVNGIRVAVIGRPNSGKSTLLNGLVGYDRAIVTDIPGTTTDTIEVFINLKGLKFTFIDTAGLRETDSPIEKMGIEKTVKEIRTADKVICLYDSLENVKEQKVYFDSLKLKNPINVFNKSDLSVLSNAGYINISAKTGEGVDSLVEELVKDFENIDFSEASIFSQRQELALKESLLSLEKVYFALDSGEGNEILVSLLSEMLWHLDYVIGSVTNDDIMDKVFNDFCLGK